MDNPTQTSRLNSKLASAEIPDQQVRISRALAISHHREGRLDEAKAVYEQLLSVTPTDYEVINLLGVLASQQGDHIKGEELIRRAVESQPTNPLYIANLGNVLAMREQFEAAKVQFEHSIELDPHQAATYHNLGRTLQRLTRFHEAIQALEKASELQPRSAEILYDLALTFIRAGQLKEAIQPLQSAVEADPLHSRSVAELSGVLGSLGRFDESLRLLDKAIAMRPTDYVLRRNRGLVLSYLCRYEDCRVEYEAALAMKPDDSISKVAMGILNLRDGNFEAGWRLYEERFNGIVKNQALVKSKRWQGESLTEKTICLVHEQGWGDTIQFIRFASVLKRRYGCTVWVSCPSQLHPLLSCIKDVDRWFVNGVDVVPDCDFFVPLMSIPGLLGGSPEIFESESYIRPDAERLRYWQKSIKATKDQLTVGLFWQGNPRHPDDSRRSIPFFELLPLSQYRNIRWVCLQKGFGVEQVEFLDPWFKFERFDIAFDEQGGAFEDTAAILSNLDLLVTCDSAVAHVAGALGVKTWMPVAADADWRWLREVQSSPWYPELQLFRQKDAGDWSSVIRAVGAELCQQDLKLVRKSAADYKIIGSSRAKLIAARYGVFSLPVDSHPVVHSLQTFGEAAESELRVIRQLIARGSTVIEIGSLVGHHTIPISRHVGETGRVIVLEPRSLFRKHLDFNLQMNSCVNVTEVRTPEQSLCDGAVFWSDARSVYRIEQCSLLKVDAVLLGSHISLRQLEPLLEFHPVLYLHGINGEGSGERSELLRSWGYTVYQHQPRRNLTDSFYYTNTYQSENSRTDNWACIPQNAAINMQGFARLS